MTIHSPASEALEMLTLGPWDQAKANGAILADQFAYECETEALTDPTRRDHLLSEASRHRARADRYRRELERLI